MKNVAELLLKENNPEENRLLFGDENGGVTYREAREKAFGIACYLKRKGIVGETILVKANRTKETLLLFLGIAASNNCYVPVSEDVTCDRLRDIISIGKAKYAFGFSGMGLIPLSLEDAINASPSEEDISSMKDSYDEGNPLYLMFTSGSTGVPKGVLKTHGNVLSFLVNFKETFAEISRGQTLANQTPFSFDASSKDIYLTLGLGGTLFIPGKEVFVLPNKSVEYLNEKKVTMIMWVPSALITIAKIRVLNFMKPQSLRYVFFIGEVFPSKYFNMWYEALPETEFFNWYGSTEIAGACLYHRLDRKLEEGETAPLGKPLSGNEVILEEGEICVKSGQVASCYIGDEEKTRATFVKEEGGVFLHTGDFATYDKNGDILFRARKDFQIKHMGYRIELQDIEASAMGLSYMASCCCLYIKEKIILVAVLNEGLKKEIGEILADLKSRLAPYMLPNRIVLLDQMPLNANGKIDRVLLKKRMEA